MTVHGLSNPAEPLLAFGEALGIASEVWAKQEELEQITYTDLEYNQEKATSITLEQIAPLIAAYHDALTCRFRLDDLTVLDIVPDVDEASLEKFRDDIQNSPTVVFEFVLDKKRLVESWLESAPGCHLFLYLFPKALESLLTSDLGRLENMLWGSETAHKVVLLVPDRDIWMDGAHLAVLGGERIGHWREAVSQPPRDADELRNMYETCQKNLNWQVPWLKHLTPLHLKVDGQIPREDLIAKALLVHQVNSIILYTAYRTVGDNDKPKLSTYAGASQSVELTLGNPADPIEEKVLAGVSDLMEMLEWAYNIEWSADDRLPLVQIVVTRALHAASPTVRYHLLLHNAPNIFDGLKWHWKAFIEGKVDSYVSQVQALEDYVADTVQTFADQIAAMIKSLSDTMLAAVAVLLGSFIAALFKDEFNPTIFTIGMVVYAVYVLIFPLCYNMWHQWERYEAMCDNFKKRQMRFKERLYKDKVDAIVGTQVIDGQRRFKRWFCYTLLAYIVVIILAIAAAWVVPGFMGSIALSAVSTHAPAP